ncbi:hypothetical protein CAPSP0001_0813 [Capnocytophaga sputigena ATCC 33612]|nr:hypothetical protein CAPSP0001_0813 [Capnocytophaga sputigena ATCC 33612]
MNQNFSYIIVFICYFVFEKLPHIGGIIELYVLCALIISS